MASEAAADMAALADSAFERVDELRRRLNFTIERAEVEKPMERRLRELGAGLRLKGFRPGKVPLNILREHLGKRALDDVLSKEANLRLYGHIRREGKDPANQPAVKITVGDEQIDVECQFDEMPKVELPDFSEISCIRPVLEVSKEDLDEAVEHLRRQATKFDKVEREAQEGDVVQAGYKISGKDTDKDSALADTGGKSVRIPLAKDLTAAPLLEALTGAKAGDRGTVPLAFPEGHYLPGFAGKEVPMEYEVKDVFAGTLPEVDEEFVKSLGIGEGKTAELRSALRENLERESVRLADFVYRQRVLDRIASSMPEFTLPQSLVASEKQEQVRQMFDSQMSAGYPGARFLTTADEEIGRRAGRKVRNGLIIRTIAAANKIKVTPSVVWDFLNKASQSDANRLMERYRDDRQYSATVDAVITESAAFGIIFGKAAVENERMSAARMREEAEGNV